MRDSSNSTILITKSMFVFKFILFLMEKRWNLEPLQLLTHALIYFYRVSLIFQLLTYYVKSKVKYENARKRKKM